MIATTSCLLKRILSGDVFVAMTTIRKVVLIIKMDGTSGMLGRKMFIQAVLMF
jgi:hypothetical protein